ncbi:hypothetical protein BN1723_005301 [Verticillium longisporum]|uniref:Uncharacterized protein n=1 Tax=Verticillium longisporum TaxID=100787 RepID=A0A0G4N687_VERLO|nr:hypothetical protein BN1723_005301 [Verticillium longisporum]
MRFSEHPKPEPGGGDGGGLPRVGLILKRVRPGVGCVEIAVRCPPAAGEKVLSSTVCILSRGSAALASETANRARRAARSSAKRSGSRTR